MNRIHCAVEFDHRDALRKMLRVLTLEEIAKYCGMQSKATVARWRDGSYPAGPEWERLKKMYAEFLVAQAVAPK